MYKLRNLFYLLILLVLPSCIHDSDNCDGPSTDDLKLDINYKDSSGKDLLKEYVSSAKLFIYNKYGDLVGTQDINNMALNSKSIGLLVPTEGSYSVVCWANVGEHTTLAQIDKRSDAL